MKIFDTNDPGLGPYRVLSSGDNILAVNIGADLGGGTLSLVITDRDGVVYYTDELTFTSAPSATVVTLAEGWDVNVELDGATDPDVQVFLVDI